MGDENNPFKDGKPCLAWREGDNRPTVIYWCKRDQAWFYDDPVLKDLFVEFRNPVEFTAMPLASWQE